MTAKKCLSRTFALSGAAWPLFVALVFAIISPARCETPRDRTEKNAVRGMTGDFDGLGMVVWVSREQAKELLPAEPDLRLDYPGDGDSYPIVLLLGAEQDVGVQKRRGYAHPKFLKHYENAYVIVPYLRHPATSNYCYTFSRIYVSDERVVEEGTKLNHSPKVHATIEDQPNRFVVNFDGQRRIDVAVLEAPAATKPQAVEASAEMSTTGSNPSTAPKPSTTDFLRAIFKQPKIEFSPRPHVFDFDFMAGASAVNPAEVSGTAILQPVSPSKDQPADIQVLWPDKPVAAVRFSGHWTKKLDY